MKKAMILFSLVTVVCMCITKGSAQEKSYIKVKGSELNGGVVILDVVKAGKIYRLQCNEGVEGCTTLGSGTYQMLELPEGFGMYDCRDVEVYPETAAVPEVSASIKSQKLGEYCLLEK